MVILLAVNVGLGNEIGCYSLDFLVCDRNPTYRVHAPYTYMRFIASNYSMVLASSIPYCQLLVNTYMAQCEVGAKQHHSSSLQVHCTNGLAASYVCYVYDYFYRVRRIVHKNHNKRKCWGVEAKLRAFLNSILIGMRAHDPTGLSVGKDDQRANLDAVA
jgi:hypothetical protein